MSKPNWEQIRKEWETTKKTYRELEEQFNVKQSTIRSRKNREKWERNATGNATQQKKSVATKKEVAIKSGKAEKSKRYPKGHPGNKDPQNQFTKRNQAARKHGLYAKYFNETQKEIMQDFEDYTVADQLWLQIEIKFSAIIQLQKIMWVENSYDTLNDLQSESSGMEGSSESYKVVYAFEQYESYIRAQSRAMAEYRNLVKQYLEMAHDDDERRLKLEQMQVSIDKTKAETENLTGSGDSNAVDDWVAAMSDIDD